MITAWTDNLKTKEEKDRFKNQLLGSKTVLNRLSELIKKEEDGLFEVETSRKIYDNPNWAYLQADMNGYRRAMKIVQKIITINDTKDNG